MSCPACLSTSSSANAFSSLRHVLPYLSSQIFAASALRRESNGEAVNSQPPKKNWGRVGGFRMFREDTLQGDFVDFEPPEWLAQIEGILETLNEGVIIADDCPQIIFANANFEAMTGMPRSDFIGSNFDKFFTPEEAETLNNHRDRGMQAGHNRFEFVLPRHDGSRLPVIVSARSIEAPDGRRFAIVTFIDISDQKRAEGNLRTANKQLEERQKEIEEDLVLAARVQDRPAAKSVAWGNARG